MPKESEVEEIVRKYLKEHGFTVRERARKQGVDITAFKDGGSYYFEVEGNAKPDGRPLNTSQKYTHLLRAIGQICLRMDDDPNGQFYLALPDDVYYVEKVAKLELALRKLGVDTYFVANDKVVETDH